MHNMFSKRLRLDLSLIILRGLAVIRNYGSKKGDFVEELAFCRAHVP